MAAKPQALTGDSIPRKAKAAADATQRGEEETTEKKQAVDLNFKVDADFKERFKIVAAQSRVKQNQLIRLALDAYERERGAKA